jgi:hypothetical protein
MRPYFFFIVFLFTVCNAFASPDLDNYQDINGVRLYTDHIKKNIFYITPSLPALGKGLDNQPDFSLEIYRYLGRKGTSDSGKFWVKGVLTIGIQRARGKEFIKKLKIALSKQHNIKYPKLRSMPVDKTKGRFLFADKGIEWSQGSRWSGKKITISLDNTMSEILWEALEAGQTLISIEMEESLSGVRKNKDKTWDKDLVAFSSTLPVELDIKKNPSLFSKIDLGGRMVRGYTGIDIFCFDFLEQLDENLYSKVVEVAIPTPKKPLVESVTFRRDSNCRTRIKFKLAKDLDIAYKVRITRIFLDGTSKTDPWVMRKGEAMLDVTDYKDEPDYEEPDYKEPDE